MQHIAKRTMTRESPNRPKTTARADAGAASACRGLPMDDCDGEDDADDEDDEDEEEDETEEELLAMKAAELKELGKERDLSDKGNKAELVARLLADA